MLINENEADNGDDCACGNLARKSASNTVPRLNERESNTNECDFLQYQQGFGIPFKTKSHQRPTSVFSELTRNDKKRKQIEVYLVSGIKNEREYTTPC
ncbi:hypothetical protein GCM10025751_28400 [Haladaptatus pallidirubidus]|uniref:Transposase n=1 Tax=Haladaptatus pallidirubidus TaxID=1008152 RepID=A0AAV3UIT9_9EURY